MSTIVQATPLPESPYPGIKSFRYLDQQLLTARKEETWNLLRNILIYRGVLLYGDSGSGKSSLVNAGLIPAALLENFIPHRLRIQPQTGKEIKIERISIEVEDKPPFLPSVFVAENSEENELQTPEISITEFYEKLKTLKTAERDQPRPLLIFDQFEEFITLFEEALRVMPPTSAAQEQLPALQQIVLRILVRLMLDETLPVKCLFVFREDYLAKLSPLLDVCPELLNQFVRLLPPRVGEAEAIIRAPFVNTELKTRFVGGPTNRVEISSELAQTVAQQLQQRSDTGFINLSELQIICRKLWDSKNPDNYFGTKNRDIQRVVEDYWAGVLNDLGDLYEPAVILLGHMVTASGTRNIISEPDLKTREKDLQPDQVETALLALKKIELVRREPRNKIYFFEIASEFLVPWIEQKKASRVAEVRAREVAIAARTELEKSEKEKRVLRIGGAVLAFLLLLAFGSFVYASYQRSVARGLLAQSITAANDLKHQKDWSGNIVKFLYELTTGEADTRLHAVNQLKHMDSKGDLPRELAPVIVAVTANDKNNEVAEAARYFFSLAAPDANNDVTVAILKSAENNSALTDATDLAPRVYIQVASDSQRARATLIAGELRKNSFTVPGFQLVDSRHAPKNNELRYYKSTDESQQVTDPNVEKLLALINGKDNHKWTSYMLKQSTRVRSGHFELWFARDSSEPDGILKLIFNDEENKQIWPEKFRVSLKSKKGFILPSKDEGSISVPPGKYSLKIRVPGYEVYESDIEITSGEETFQPVRLHVPNRGP